MSRCVTVLHLKWNKNDGDDNVDDENDNDDDETMKMTIAKTL